MNENNTCMGGDPVLTMSNIAVEKAKKIVREYGERNADRLARDLGIIVLPRPFKHQKGAYKIIERNRFVFVKEDLDPIMRAIVLLHEIGHDALHRKEAIACGGFQEFTLFDMRDKRMEYEANMFAAEIALPDEDVLECISLGYDVRQIARDLNSDINLVALKTADLNRRGYHFRAQEHRCDFLK